MRYHFVQVLITLFFFTIYLSCVSNGRNSWLNLKWRRVYSAVIAESFRWYSGKLCQSTGDRLDPAPRIPYPEPVRGNGIINLLFRRGLRWTTHWLWSRFPVWYYFRLGNLFIFNLSVRRDTVVLMHVTYVMIITPQFPNRPIFECQPLVICLTLNAASSNCRNWRSHLSFTNASVGSEMDDLKAMASITTYVFPESLTGRSVYHLLRTF